MYVPVPEDYDQNSRSTNSIPSQPGQSLYQLCSQCCQPIIDQFYLVAADRPWHINCLQCSLCNVHLETELSCFTKDGQIFCKDDYYRQFSKRCARCSRVLTPKERVMKAKHLIFHQSCFTCIICSCSLNPGDYFGLSSNDYIYCRLHYEPLLESLQLSVPDFPTSVHPAAMEMDPAATMVPGAPGLLMPSDPVSVPVLVPIDDGAMRKPTRSKRRRHVTRSASETAQSNVSPSPLHPSTSIDSCMSMLSDNQISISMSQHQQSSARNKRMRTSFKHHQLRTMKQYFSLNHNPDAKDLKQLAQKTGLTKRVLQVWFQNARAKYRRSVQLKGGDCSGIGGEVSLSDGGKENRTGDGGATPASGDEALRSSDEDDGDADGGISSPLGGRQDTLSTASDVTTPTRYDEICYSPHYGCLSDDDSASKSLAVYFQQHCDGKLL